MITQIEQAICQRLTAGLGRMTRAVTSYGGEIDDDLGRIVRELPAAWVTFGGISKTEPFSVSKRQYKPTGQFVVIVGDYSTRSEATARSGGVNVDEVGCYRLVYAVRRLLTGQDLGLKINPLVPGRVRTLFNTQVAERALSIFACEFDTQWLETALALGHGLSKPPTAHTRTGCTTNIVAECPSPILICYGSVCVMTRPVWVHPITRQISLISGKNHEYIHCECRAGVTRAAGKPVTALY